MVDTTRGWVLIYKMKAYSVQMQVRILPSALTLRKGIKMKIIRSDNFNRDYISDALIAENVNEYYGNLIVKLLNTHEGEDSLDFYKVVADEYKLYKFIP